MLILRGDHPTGQFTVTNGGAITVVAVGADRDSCLVIGVDVDRYSLKSFRLASRRHHLDC